MHEELEKHLEQALVEFSGGEHFDVLVQAKKEYFERTGRTLEEDENYESRMRTFNDWYVLQYATTEENGRVIDRYLSKNQVAEPIIESFKNFNHALFEYTGLNLKKRHVLKDLLHDKKIILSASHAKPPLIKGDLFLGRSLVYEEENYLMSGICILPGQVKSILKKECKKIRKLDNREEEFEFLLQVESFRSRWFRYGHVDAKKIFDFSKIAE